MEAIHVKRALLSVSDKTGLVEFARALAARGVEIVSTGGTARALEAAGVPVIGVPAVTGFPEMLEGRVKTLHPKIHGGILADRDKPDHTAAIAEHAITPIDLVCVNLYPFAAAIARPGATLEDAIENIDIGGPSLVRSAAKNHGSVAVVIDPADYPRVLEELSATGALSLATRRRLAAKAFAHTADYETAIADYMKRAYAPSIAGESVPEAEFPEVLRLGYERAQILRYGENPHQKAAFYREPGIAEPCIGSARRVDRAEREVSFNNLFDLNAALELVKEFPEGPAAAVIKHTNPCGCALGDTLAEAFRRAREGDPVSAFGGILAFNRPVDVATAKEVTSGSKFDAIIAPGYLPEALPVLTQRKKWGANLILLEVGGLSAGAGLAGPSEAGPRGYDLKRVVGGLLVQERDYRPLTPEDLKVVSRRPPSPQELDELLFAWRVVKHVKSNAIVVTRDRTLRGTGAGQMNRVRSVRLAVEQAGEHVLGAALASDAFFPFPDGPEAAGRAGVTAIIQPGGSVKDAETIAVCDRYNIALVFTGVRHFRH